MDEYEKLREEMRKCKALALEARCLFKNGNVLAAVEKRAAGAKLEGIYLKHVTHKKRKRVIATVTLVYDHVELVMTGWGRNPEEATMHALSRPSAQNVLPFPDPEDLPF